MARRMMMQCTRAEPLCSCVRARDDIVCGLDSTALYRKSIATWGALACVLLPTAFAGCRGGSSSNASGTGGMTTTVGAGGSGGALSSTAAGGDGGSSEGGIGGSTESSGSTTTGGVLAEGGMANTGGSVASGGVTAGSGMTASGGMPAARWLRARASPGSVVTGGHGVWLVKDPIQEGTT